MMLLIAQNTIIIICIYL